jgi:hypothetical protein
MELRNDLITLKHTRMEHEDDYRYNAPHRFRVFAVADGRPVGEVHFQEGPIGECGVNGVNNEDLIAMVLRRLEGFQDSEFKCRENEKALEKLEEALMWLRRRTTKREIRGVEGTHIV